jgi:hypothetical protein
MTNGVFYSVVFFSWKLSLAKYNYKIYNKELLVIINVLEQWRPELKGTKLLIQVLTDYKALEYFITSKKLTRQQA